MYICRRSGSWIRGYHNAVKLNNFGYGCAMGIILAAIIALFSAAQFCLAKSGN